MSEHRSWWRTKPEPGEVNAEEFLRGGQQFNREQAQRTNNAGVSFHSRSVSAGTTGRQSFPIQEMHWPPPEDTQQPSDWPPPQTWTSRVPSVNLPARVVQTTNPYRVQAASYRMPVTVKSPRPSYPSIAPSRATSGGLQVAQPYNIQQMVYEQQLQPNRLQRRPGAPDDGGWGCGGGDC